MTNKPFLQYCFSDGQSFGIQAGPGKELEVGRAGWQMAVARPGAPRDILTAYYRRVRGEDNYYLVFRRF